MVHSVCVRVCHIVVCVMSTAEKTGGLIICCPRHTPLLLEMTSLG